jgi:hypothetical protein
VSYHQYPKSGAAIPTNAVSLSEAFCLFSKVEISDDFSKTKPDDDGDKRGSPVSPEVEASLAKMSALGKAELVFRDALVKGELVAQIRDPRNGQNLQPSDRLRWSWKSSFEPTGIGEGEDYVWSDDSLSPGPNTEINGQVHPVFFIRADFERWLNARKRARINETGISALARMRAWLKAEMTQNERPQKNKPEYAAQANTDFGIGPNQFRREWDRALDETERRATWAVPGRKKNRAA